MTIEELIYWLECEEMEASLRASMSRKRKYKNMYAHKPDYYVGRAQTLEEIRLKLLGTKEALEPFYSPDKETLR